MNFIPYKVNEVLDNVFYQIQKELLVNPIYNNLDSNSILLYGLLLDRLSVSMKNKWFDKDGNIYLIYSRKEAQKMLKLSDKTTTKAFKNLEEAKLIYENRSGYQKSNIIYVGIINHQPISKIMNRKNYDSRVVKSTTDDTENLRRSNNKYNKNNYSNKSFHEKSKFHYEQREYTEEELEALYCN